MPEMSDLCNLGKTRLRVQDLRLASLSAPPALGRGQTAITQQFLFW